MPMISHSSIRYWAKAKSRYAFSIRTGVKARSVRPSFCGLWRVRHLHNRRLLTDRLEAGSAPLTLWQAATADTLPDDSLLPPPVAGLMNGLPLAHELLAHVRDPALQPHSINLTQLPLSEADRLFLARLCGHGNIRFASPGMAKAKSTPQHCAISGMCAVWTPLKGRCSIAMRFVLCRSWYWRPRKIWPIRASADEVCRWLETR